MLNTNVLTTGAGTVQTSDLTKKHKYPSEMMIISEGYCFYYPINSLIREDFGTNIDGIASSS